MTRSGRSGRLALRCAALLAMGALGSAFVAPGGAGTAGIALGFRGAARSGRTHAAGRPALVSLRAAEGEAAAQAAPAQLVEQAAQAALPYQKALAAGDWAGLQAAFAANEAPAIAAGALVVLVLAAAASGGGAKPETPYPKGVYDRDGAEAYFAARPALVLRRTLELVLLSGAFGASLLLDQATGKLEDNAEKRAAQLTTLLTRLGPTFIKIGQSLSIRTDLLPPKYIGALQQLQDQVPAFDTAIALQTIEEELGRPASELFEGITKPIAAASLGQVYRAKIASGDRKGTEVAIKVQRPQIMEQVALDMHLIRKACPLFKLATGYPGDAEGLVDDWGKGFVNELDYQEEAKNGEYFTECIQKTPLADVVFAPAVVGELTKNRVLTTEWVLGERLERSSAKDVSGLCSIAMNSYLTMMLETGKLHCDPHPGNLLRTPDGKLCILDWGLVQPLPDDLRLTFIEHIAHLTAKDYAKVPNDLVLLGFVPEGKEEDILKTDAVNVLANVYTQLAGGGGAKKIDVNAVVNELAGLTEQYGQLFQVPPYFAYIGRAFSVLEGIGIGNDPDYSIINECLPYIAQRLITDPSPRTAGALNTFVFGTDKDRPDRLLDVDRVQTLVEGFGSYSAAAGGAGLLGDRSREQMVEDVADKVSELLLSQQSTPLQAIVLEQIAKVVGAGSRATWQRIREASGRTRGGRSIVGLIVDPLGIFQRSSLVNVDDEDRVALEATEKLVALLREASMGSELAQMSPDEVRSLSRIVARKLWARRRELVLTGNRLGLELLKQTADRLERQSRTPSWPAAAPRARLGAAPRGTPPSTESTTISRSDKGSVTVSRKRRSQ